MRIGILCEWAKIKLDGIEWNEWEGNERWEGEKGKENVSGESVREERKKLEEENEERRWWIWIEQSWEGEWGIKIGESECEEK